ncbi:MULTISPECIES: WD40 repeat domain-containing serine/threonine protein kinase [unclassified Streptomyces]|uniref:WD40 repeat domain-containing serine/threonine protein kinase n=1 Tax=unclassified Streptomyces TaxID=2593676 RepID=UPI0036EB0564
MASTVWQPGEVVLDLYEVLDDVRSGGMGTVQRVRHLGWNVDLAVKTPRPERVASPEGRRRFEAEAGTWVGLGLHPHTVNCAYVRTVGGVPRVFAEWVDGGDLAEAVAGGRLYEGGSRAALARVLDVAVQTAWGLQHAHDTGLVHQDVKPANVMLEPDGIAKVTDFGLAGARAPDADGTTASGVTFGGMTRPYCSPEQALAAAGRREIRLTPATDVWSWALTVLEMFTGRRPTDYGQAAAEALDGLMAGGPEDPRVPPLPPAVAGLLRQCFMTAVTARPSRLDEVAGVLSEVYGDVLGTPYPRPVPEAAALLADGLSNQALSLLDLGRTEEAEERWREAMTADPHSLITTFNFGLHRWRDARKTDAELVAELTSAREIGGDDALGARLIGLVHLERDDRERAAELLRPVAPGEPEPAETAEALAELARDPGARPVVLAGHEGVVSAVAVTADGGLVLSGDYQGVLRLWEAGSGRCLRELTSGGSHVVAVAVDSEGRIGLVGREQGLPEAWDLARGERLPLPTGPVAEGVTSVALSADGSVGATAHADGNLWFWHLDTGGLLGPVPSGTERMTALELGDGGGIAVTAGGLGETTIRLWDAGAGVCRAVLTEPRQSGQQPSAWGGFVRRAAVAPGARYALQVWHGPMVLWNVTTGRIAAQVPHDVTDVSALALTPDGSLAVVGGGQPLRAVQTATGRCLRTFDDGMSRHTFHLAVSGDGSRAVLAVFDGRIRVQPLPVPRYRAPWAYARPRAAGELTDHAGRFRAAMREGERLFEEGRYAQSAACLRTARAVPGHARNPELLHVWSALGRHGRRTGLLGAWQTFDFTGRLGSPSAMAFVGDTSVFLAGLFPDRFLLCDAADARRNRMIASMVTAAAAPLMTGDGAAAVVPGRSEAALLDLRDDRTVLLERDDIRAVALTHDRAWLLTGEDSGTLCLWDVDDVQRQQRYAEPSSGFRGHQGPVGAVAISPDRRYGASNAFTGAEEDRRRRSDLDELCGWDLASGRRLWRHIGRPGGANLRFAPDGRSLLEYGQFGVHAYDAASGRRIYSVEGPYNIATLQVSADGRRAVIAGYGTLVVLDPATGRVLREIPDPGLINTVVLTLDGRFAVCGLADEDVHLWDLDQGLRLRVLEGHRGQVFGLALSADARRLLVAELDYVRCLELDWDYEW